MSWTEVPIHTACIAAVDCINRTAPTVDYETPYKMIRTSNIRNGFIDTKNVKYVTEDVFERWTRRLVPRRGDVVLTREAPLGEVGRITTDENIFLGQRIIHYRPDPNILDSNFLAYVLQSPIVQNRIKSVGSGVTVEHARVGDCLNLLIPLPPLDIQKRIGDILSAYDDLVENNKRRIVLLEQSVRLLFNEWFVHFRFPGHEHVKIIGGVPVGWKKVCVPDIIEINPIERVETGKEIRYVPMSALSETGMTINLREIEIRDKATSVKFRNGDTLLARITPCLENGKTAYVNFLQDDEVASGSTEFIVLRGREVSSYFVYCLSRTYEFRENAIKSMIGSSGRQRVQVTCFNEFQLVLPPTTLLEQFNEIAESSFNTIANLQFQIDLLIKSRDLLLPRLMKGEIQL